MPLTPPPGRHVKGGIGLMQANNPDPAKYNPEGSGEPDLAGAANAEITNTTGLCLFGTDLRITGVPRMAGKLMQAVTGFGIHRSRRESPPACVYSICVRLSIYGKA